jgi:hypothetical protein
MLYENGRRIGGDDAGAVVEAWFLRTLPNS